MAPRADEGIEFRAQAEVSDVTIIHCCGCCIEIMSHPFL